jgi:hypothetical protein
VAPLLDRPDEVALDLVVALVPQRHDAAAGGRAGALAAVDDHRLVEQLGELADAQLHAALVLPGGVVVGVLAQVAELPSRLDGAGDVDPAAGREIVQLLPETLVGGPGQMGLGHSSTLQCR